MITPVTRIEGEDMQRLLMVSVPMDAMKANPDAFSAEETKQIHMAYYRAMGELMEKHGVDGKRDWRFSQFTGDIWYED